MMLKKHVWMIFFSVFVNNDIDICSKIGEQRFFAWRRDLSLVAPRSSAPICQRFELTEVSCLMYYSFLQTLHRRTLQFTQNTTHTYHIGLLMNEPVD